MSYTSEQIFEDNSLNGLMDFFHEKVREAFPIKPPEIESIAAQQFVLADKAAFMLQGETEEPLKQIVLKTSNDKIYEFLAFNLQTIFPISKSIAYKDKIFLYVDHIFFEIWFDSELEIVGISPSLYVEQIKIA